MKPGMLLCHVKCGDARRELVHHVVDLASDVALETPHNLTL